MPQPATITIPDQTFTTAQLLALTEYRIAAILAGAQAYGTNGRQLTHADLGLLYEQRDKLRQEVALEAAGAEGGGDVLVRFGNAV
jgi:hypothetical protein